MRVWNCGWVYQTESVFGLCVYLLGLGGVDVEGFSNIFVVNDFNAGFDKLLYG